MSFCHECGKKLKESAKFCTSCGAKVETKKVKEESKIEHKEEKIIIKEKSSGSSFWKIFGIIILVGIIAAAIIIGFIAYGEISSSGGIGQAIDPCLRQRDSCYSACGEGIYSKVTFCKDRCDSDYRECKGY